MSDNRFQNIYVELNNGQVGMFSGPVLIENDTDVFATKVSFSQPKDLPDQLTWDGLWRDTIK